MANKETYPIGLIGDRTLEIEVVNEGFRIAIGRPDETVGEVWAGGVMDDSTVRILHKKLHDYIRSRGL